MSETTFAGRDCDTDNLTLSRGDRVVLALGDLNGMEGTVIDFRADARVLVGFDHGFTPNCRDSAWQESIPCPDLRCMATRAVLR